MKKTNNSIFTRVLAMILCLIMLVGIMSACANHAVEDKKTDESSSTTPPTGDNTAKEPEKDPVKDPEEDTTDDPKDDPVDDPTDDPVDDPTDDPVDDPTDDPVDDPVDPNEIFTGSASIGQESLIYGTLASNVTIGTAGGVGAIIPANVKIAAGTSSLDLSVRSLEANDGIILGNGESAQSLDVHITGVAADNTIPMTVNLGVVLATGLSNTELKFYHIEDGTPVLMTRVDSASDFAIHNQYTYNPETGEVSIYVASFSVFSAVQTSASKWDENTEADTSWYNENDTEFTLEDVADFLGFRDLVDGGNTFEGKTIILGTDIDLSDKPFDPIGFGYYKDDKRVEEDGVLVSDTNTVFLGTFDGGNHTIYNLYQNGWELDPDKTNYSTYTYSTAGAGLFASIKNATIKNIAISGAEVVFECVDMGVLVGYAQGECHFENIVITDANIANYNRYTGGLVGEVSYGVDNNGDGYSHTFKNITIDSTVTVSGLWGSFGCGMGGVIGGKWGDATVLMENVVSAPVMDVYNDVVSAYQWYAFRGCGMLIGHTEEPYSDGRHSGIATAGFLTCENVKVYYGDWVNYTYYEFANQIDAEGNTLWYSNYPWVRAEEGVYCDAFSNIRYGIPLINGVPVTELSKEDFDKAVTSTTKIIFNQLYGADRGMYGQATHKGVTVIDNNTKTIYIKNNLGWENLKLHYWYKHGDDTWTNIDTNGVALTEENGVYRVDLPAYAFAFNITADGDNFTEEFILSELNEDSTITLGTEKTPVASVNGVEYASLQEAINAANGATVTILADVTLTEALIVDGKNVVIDLNGKTISANYDGVEINGKNIVEVLWARNGASVTITGNGTMIADGNGEYIQVISATDDANVTIENGTFVSNGCTAIYATLGATVTINGGHFDAKEKYEGKYYTLDVNETEPNMGKIIVNGGSFVNFDPANHTIDGPGYTNKVSNGYHSVKVDDVYIVSAHAYNESVTAPTCTEAGYTTYTCSCGDSFVGNETGATGHTFVDNVCSCGATPTITEYEFTFGENGPEGHKDQNTEKSEYSETINGLTLSIVNGSKVYSESYDEKGNSCIKIGTSKQVGSFSFVVPQNIDKVIIYVAGYKDVDANVIVNDVSYTIKTHSNDGEYTAIEIDTTENKTISFATENKTDDRCMINTIVFMDIPEHDCDKNIDIPAKTATCTEDGLTEGKKCSVCGKITVDQNEVAATGHVNTTTITVDATCTEAGSTTVTCACGETVSTVEIPATGHNYVDGTCDCGATEPEPTHECESKCAECDKCTNAECEEDACADKCEGHAVTPTSNRYYIATIRTSGNYFYMTSNLGTASTKRYTAVDSGLTTLPTSISNPEKGYVFVLIDNGDGTYSLQAEGVEGNNYLGWTSGNSGTLVAEEDALKLTVDKKEDGTYNIHFNGDAERYLALNGTSGNNYFAWYKSGQKQNLTLIPVEGGGSEGGETPCEHTNATTTTVDATCTTTGVITVICDDCGVTVSTTPIEVLGHEFINGECSREGCDAKDPNAGSTTEKMDKTKYSFSIYTTGTQYAQGEEHQLDENTKLTINGAHLNTQIRLYAGSNCVFEFAKTVESIEVTAGNKAGTLTVYVSNDGKTWTKIQAVSTTTSYTAYSVDLDGSYQYVKLESAGAQIRVSIMTVNP